MSETLERRRECPLQLLRSDAWRAREGKKAMRGKETRGGLVGRGEKIYIIQGHLSVVREVK